MRRWSDAGLASLAGMLAAVLVSAALTALLAATHPGGLDAAVAAHAPLWMTGAAVGGVLHLSGPVVGRIAALNDGGLLGAPQGDASPASATLTLHVVPVIVTCLMAWVTGSVSARLRRRADLRHRGRAGRYAAPGHDNRSGQYHAPGHGSRSDQVCRLGWYGGSDRDGQPALDVLASGVCGGLLGVALVACSRGRIGASQIGLGWVSVPIGSALVHAAAGALTRDRIRARLGASGRAVAVTGGVLASLGILGAVALAATGGLGLPGALLLGDHPAVGPAVFAAVVVGPSAALLGFPATLGVPIRVDATELGILSSTRYDLPHIVAATPSLVFGVPVAVAVLVFALMIGSRHRRPGAAPTAALTGATAAMVAWWSSAMWLDRRVGNDVLESVSVSASWWLLAILGCGVGLLPALLGRREATRR